MRRYYPNYSEIAKRLPHRSASSIRNRAQQVKIASPAAWSVADNQRLRKMWPVATRAQIEATFPGVTWKGLQSRARRLRLKRGRLVPSTGVPVLDAIREMAIRRNLTLSDLDEATREGGTFFRDMSTIPARAAKARRPAHEFVKWGRVADALKAMGARLVIDWQDGDGDGA